MYLVTVISNVQGPKQSVYKSLTIMGACFNYENKTVGKVRGTTILKHPNLKTTSWKNHVYGFSNRWEEKSRWHIDIMLPHI